jgi:SPP1 gp7 family putative phage head morphogenesis protein
MAEIKSKPKKIKQLINQVVKSGDKFDEKDLKNLLKDTKKISEYVNAIRKVQSLKAIYSKIENLSEEEFLNISEEKSIEMVSKSVSYYTSLGIEQSFRKAFNVQQWNLYEEFKDARPYIMYTAIDDNRVRHNHVAMDQVIRPIYDPVWDTWLPANGYNCRCGTISLNEDDLQKYGGETISLPKVLPDEGFRSGKKTLGLSDFPKFLKEASADFISSKQLKQLNSSIDSAVDKWSDENE